MKIFNFKKIFLLNLIVLIALILPTKIFAANESVAIVKINEDYSIYINGLEEKDFKFGFTNQKPIEGTTSDIDLVANWEDKKGVNIACLESSSEIDLTKKVYMLIEKDEETTVTELDLSDAITQEEMSDVESLTTIISVDTKKTTTTADNENGVATTQTVGQVDIIKSEEYEYQDYDYKYQLIKIDGTESENAKKLITLVDEIQTSYSKLSTYNKILVTTQIKELYNSVKNEAKLQNVIDYVIYQPIDSKEGDKYLVLLQQLSKGKVVREDIQFLVCTEGHEEEVVKETKEIKKATVLPRTYDSIILFIILAIIVITAIVVMIRMKNLKSENNVK